MSDLGIQLFHAGWAWLVGAMFLMPGLSYAQSSPAPVEVMIVGVYHMANPGHDFYDVKADDVLAPKRQVEISAIASALAKFKPNKIGVEWPEDVVDVRYPKYLAGTLAPSRNEVVQLGFRLAKLAGSKAVYGMDADGDFPYPQLKAYANTHGFGGLLAEQDALVQRQVAEEARVLATKGVSAELRLLNDPARLKEDHAFYRAALRIGENADQPGADLLTAWYRRNFLICAKLLQRSRPGDRIVIFFGAGHAYLLRQCVSETSGFQLVEPNDYLQP
ncbi:MAG TPA: DUF5694 domain-containing protein [Dyella sp.]|uniref:DUF5694 domain-containing protein n=1 Tax=Dyella sp. TaxID=1869338 RepID=UPI002CBC5A85|nr:DUF5694 domain-containing protein [Dyella sp.]HUB89015.1 DUF5694 domain-containing protein [Dyella sp.]